MTPYQLFVGIDIAATSVTCSWRSADGSPTRPITIDQTAAGYTSLEQALLASGCAAPSILVALEATGTYWVCLASYLVQAGFAVSVINPSQAHAFAKALLKRAKTDAIDAQSLQRADCRD